VLVTLCVLAANCPPLLRLAGIERAKSRDRAADTLSRGVDSSANLSA
jgi:hypothetical protein